MTAGGMILYPGKSLKFATEQADFPLPPLVIQAGPQATKSVHEFFFGTISNPNTRAAYARAIGQFFVWCERRGISLEQIEPLTVAAYIRQHPAAAPTVKQHLAAIRMLFDYLVVTQVVPHNPAASVKGPSYVVKKGKTPVLTGSEARTLLASINTSTLVGLRNRALIGTMIYSFARISAVVNMNVEDYFQSGSYRWLRLLEKGSRHHELPAHHSIIRYLDEYLAAAGIAGERKNPLFRTFLRRTGQLTSNRLDRAAAFRMVRQAAIKAGLGDRICNHTFRATGITAYLSNNGTLEKAQQIAAHASPRTTKLYDRTNDALDLDEIERIIL